MVMTLFRVKPYLYVPMKLQLSPRTRDRQVSHLARHRKPHAHGCSCEGDSAKGHGSPQWGLQFGLCVFGLQGPSVGCMRFRNGTLSPKP